MQNSENPGKNLNLAVRKMYVVLLTEFSSTLKTNLSLQEYQQEEHKSLKNPKVPQWLIVAIKEYLFVIETPCSIVKETVRSLLDSL